jgi:tetratricopeptide (TPR) repeat protein
MARDWDLLVSFLIPVQFLVIYLLVLYFHRGKESHQIVLVILILGVLRVGAWIGINADPDRHLQRAEILTAPGLSGTFPVIYYEALGKIFWHRNEFDRSRIWYERYLTIDSLNPRILGNLAAVYNKLGMKGQYFETLKRAASTGTKETAIYLNLGTEYVERKDTAAGIRMNTRALETDPSSPEAHANLGLIYATQRNFQVAAPHFAQAIAFGIRDPLIYRYAGYAYLNLNDFTKGLHYLDIYISLAPADKGVQADVERIKQRMRAMGGGNR